MTRNVDVAIVGGGPAGLAAALSAHKAGARSILVLERDSFPGGILQQCIHNGFGLQRFGEELTGPEYAGRYIEMLKSTSVEVCSDTMVLELKKDRTVCAVNGEKGYFEVRGKAVILAMGCRERTRGAISIPGKRPAGVFTAGAAQRFLNIEGFLCGKRVVILGSGDIGLISARRMTLEGAKVLACVELMPYSSGLQRNIVQCLEDFDIPLYLSHTVTKIHGDRRVTGVTVQKVDEQKNPIPGTEMDFECDNLLLSVGLIPENELTKGADIRIDPRTNGPEVYDNLETSAEGIFACGNVVHVHDLVDYVSEESARAGAGAARRIAGNLPEASGISVEAGNAVSYVVPQHIRNSEDEKTVPLFFRVRRMLKKVRIEISDGKNLLASYPREYMAPGEMEKLFLPRKLLQDCTRIVVSIRE